MAENHTEQPMDHHKRALMGLKMRDHVAARAAVEADIGGRPQIQWRNCLRFVAAVSVSCSGDKSDKEESAGCFGAMGIVTYCCVV